jgi:hypothetical protein
MQQSGSSEEVILRSLSGSWLAAAVVLIAVPMVGVSQVQQAAQSGGTLSVAGASGQAPLIQINGRSYVDIESLARLTHGSLSFQTNHVTLALPAVSPAPAVAPLAKSLAKPGFTAEFLKSGIEEMAVIREWRIAIVNAVQTNNPVTDDWVAGYRRSAENRLALASAAATSDSDRKASVLLQNEFNNMLQMSDRFLAQHRNVSYTSPTSFDNNSEDEKILSCSKALASMAATGVYQDEVSCH